MYSQDVNKAGPPYFSLLKNQFQTVKENCWAWFRFLGSEKLSEVTEELSCAFVSNYNFKTCICGWMLSTHLVALGDEGVD